MFGSCARWAWNDSVRLNTMSGANDLTFSTMATTLSNTASVSVSWPMRCRHSSTSASVGLPSSLRSVAGENSSSSLGARCRSNRMRILTRTS